MSFNGLTVILADAAPAAAPANQPQDRPSWTGIVPIALMLVMLYVIFFGPQAKKQKEQRAMLNTVKPGDKIVTSSGIVGTVVSVKDKTLAIRSAETKLEILKTALTEITERGGDSGGNES